MFTQTAVDDQGRPVRDEDSKMYVGAIGNRAEEFGLRIYTEAWNRVGTALPFLSSGGCVTLDLECRRRTILA